MITISSDMLKQRQQMSLKDKIDMSLCKIEQWHDHWDGQVAVSFSGGKDSTVLLHLVRSVFPDVPAVFVNTGLEFPEIVKFVKTIDNVIWLKPKKRFPQIIDEYGYPIISKKISMGFDRYDNTSSQEQKNLRLFGGINPSSGKKQQATISKKYHYLLNSKFKFSERCCYFMKKSPLKNFSKKTGLMPLIATMASDSNLRQQFYLQNGCNAFHLSDPKSFPLSFWNEKDIWDYIGKLKVPYSIIYTKGHDRTGCMFCMFGVHLEKENRFQKMKETHPKLHAYGKKLKIDKVMEELGLPYD